MSGEGSLEEYRRLMASIIGKLVQRASGPHKERLATELQWLTAWVPEEDAASAYESLQQRHRSLPVLFQAVVESAATADQALFGAEILNEFIRADDLVNTLAEPDIVRKRMSRVARRDHDSRSGPIFLVSSWRSGSTLLMALLGSHPHLVALPENNLLDPFLAASAATTRNIRPLIYRARPTIVDACGSTAHLGVTDDRFYECFATFIDSVVSGYVRANGGRRWVYKEMANAESLPLIDILFGYRARFIWLVRHGLDVVHSEIERYERRGVQSADLSEYAHEWAAKNELLADFHERTSQRCARVRYEDLVGNPVAEARRLLGFLEEPWDEELFNRMQSSTRALGGDSKFTRSGGTIDATRTGRWKQWPRIYIEQMGRIVNPTLRRAGYDAV